MAPDQFSMRFPREMTPFDPRDDLHDAFSKHQPDEDYDVRFNDERTTGIHPTNTRRTRSKER